jgi:vacuolar-type H+-ATPase catalytic subunit A/Vma1
LNKNRKVPVLTEEEELKYRNTKKCENCGVEFGSKRYNGEPVVKVRHHDLATNKFFGAWCSLCNMRNKNRYFKTIVYLHNFSGYDDHSILKYATKYMHEYSPWLYNTQKIISKSSEKIKHFQYAKFIFMNSMNHLNSSLDSLMEILDKSNHDFEIFNKIGLNPILRSKEYIHIDG